MTRVLTFCFTTAFLLTSVSALAQAPQGRQGGGRGPAAAPCSTVACDMLADWERTRTMMIGVAEAMPEDKYSFKPTPAQQSFGERLMHVAQIDTKVLATLGGKTPAPMVNMSATSKADVIAALRQTFDWGAALLKEFSDAQLTERITPLPFLGQSSSRARVFSWDLQHTNDIYGQLVVYLRLNGITPPASNRGA